MHESIQKQLYSHYRLWYNTRNKTKDSLYVEVTCNKCRKKFDKSVAIIRKYGEQQKVFYYCPVCAPTLKSPR